MNVRETFNRYIAEEFDEASAAFKSNTSANNWKKLEAAMWALQAIRPLGALTSDEIDSIIHTKPIASWIDEVIARAKGQDNADR